VVGALGLGVLKRHLSSNTILAIAAGLFAAAFATLALTSSLAVAIPLLVVCGFGWASTVATITAELQLFVPGWVRARALGILLMVFLGTQAITAPIWGQVTAQLGLRTTLLICAALLAVSTLMVVVLRVPDSQNLDRSPLAYWDTPRLAVGPDGASPVTVSIRYQVHPDQQAAFVAAMEPMRRSRLRSGAIRWNLYRVGEDPNLFVEQFAVASWHEHQRQHDERLTAEDQAIEQAAFAHLTGAPQPHHLLPATEPLLRIEQPDNT
jgi:MFS family permease